jgi:three-Cys-motif partner protein
MIKPDYWNIKPHTERKLQILDKYLNAWCDIIFKYYHKNPEWTAWQTPFFVDCFSGRGMYHKDGKLDSVKGSPLIAIEKFIEKKKLFEQKFKVIIKPKIKLIEFVPEYAKELELFTEKYSNEIDIKVLNGDFNDLIGKVVNETGYSHLARKLLPCHEC